MALKPICFLTVHFRFSAFWFPASVCSNPFFSAVTITAQRLIGRWPPIPLMDERVRFTRNTRSFEMAVISVYSKNARETRISANSSSTSDFKILHNLLYSFVKYGHPSGRISVVDMDPPDPTIIAHIGQITCSTFTHLIWVVFSLFPRMRVARCVASGETRSKLLTASKPFWYPARLCGIPPRMESKHFLLHFMIFWVLAHVALLLWGVCPAICD